MRKLLNAKNFLFLFSILVLYLSVFVRFYNLNWGQPFFFHPDERNIASAITRLDTKNSMNPEFFAYGSLPIYTAYFIGLAENFILAFPEIESLSLTVEFEQAIIILRVISAVLSSLIILIVFSFVKRELNLKYAVLASGLCGLNVGLIQYAHFGTFEIWLTFLSLTLLFSTYYYLEKSNFKWILGMGLSLGMLISVKMSSIIFLPFITVIIVASIFRKRKDFKNFKNYTKTVLFSLSVFLMALFILAITSPFIFLDFKSFEGSINYESAVALGSIEVFYTAGFKNTIPVFYQLAYVYPFILNPVNLIFFLISLPVISVAVIRRQSNLLTLSLIFFLLLFLSQAFFYVKWIRYYIPTIPFVIIILVFGIKIFSDSIDKKYRKKVFAFVFSLTMISSFIFSLSYFLTVLYPKDTRLEAYDFLRGSISANSKIISEVFDLGIVPFNQTFNNITLFNFYELDDEWNKEIREEELESLMSESDYLILPSQRIIRNRLLKKEDFPKGYKFYNGLEEHELVYSTPCDIFCRILYLNDPIFALEETANVFDRPNVKIYKINK